MSMFGHLPLAPVDAILGTALAFKADTDPRKINCGIGAYRTDDGKPMVLDIVRKVEQEIAADPAEVKEYAPVDGLHTLKQPTQELIFGKGARAITEGRICSAQGLSGTGSLRMVAELLAWHQGAAAKHIWCPKPTWGNHHAIFKRAGLEVHEYPYWDAATRGLDFAGMMGALSQLEAGTTVLLHAVAHNPTGVDPTEDQWQQIMNVVKERKLFAILDNAYQGFASGSLDTDAFSVRMFEQAGLEFAVCQSFAKNMGLYGERMGMIHIVCNTKEVAEILLSQLKLVIRPCYSSPPIHGAQLVTRILTNPDNLGAWERELKAMADRINLMRTKLRSALEAKQTPGTWNHITDQIGMFSFTGLSPEQCQRMIDTHHIYMLKNGRISMAGVNTGNVEYMAAAIDDCVRNV